MFVYTKEDLLSELANSPNLTKIANVKTIRTISNAAFLVLENFLTQGKSIKFGTLGTFEVNKKFGLVDLSLSKAFHNKILENSHE